MEINRDDKESIRGGEAIASGGFGCVFKPALSCKNGTRSKNKVTKLMSRKYAIKEYEFIEAVKSRISKIPNYANYFLVDNFEICEPVNLDKNDIKNFDEKCNALKKHSKLKTRKTSKRSRSKMSVDYLNKHLDDVLSLNMPDGGVDLDKYLEKYNSKKTFLKLNNALINLLLYGIVPMNRMHVYHCDIKDTNIMVKKKKVRLIDWGLSVFEKPNNNSIPLNLYRRPFQYNVPFSSVIFNDDFIDMYEKFLKDYANEPPSSFELHDFVIRYILFWNEERGTGHLKTINKMVKHLMQLQNQEQEIISAKKMEDYNFAYYFIIEYLTRILQEFTKNGKFLIYNYLNEVFMKNIDIWGFVMSYMSFFEHFDNMEHKEPVHLEIMNKIKDIVLQFLFDTPTKPINVEELVKELKDLNKIITYMNGSSIKSKSNRSVRGGKNKTMKVH